MGAARDADGGAPSRRAPFLIAGAASLWGLWSIPLRYAERASTTPLSSQLEALIIFATMFVVLLPFALHTILVRERRPRSRSAWLLLAALGAADGLNMLCFLTAMQKTTVAVAVLTHYLAPILVAVTAPLVLRERWRARTFVALAIALTGLVLLLQPWSSTVSSLEGALWGAASALFFASTVLMGKFLSKDGQEQFSPIEMSVWPKATSLLVLIVALPSGSLGTLEATPFGWVALGSLICGALPLVIYFRGLARTPASTAGVLMLMEPLVAVIVGVAVWNETLSGLGVVGALLVLLGAFAITRRT